MGELFTWLAINVGTIFIVAVVVLILVVWIRKKVSEGQTEQVLAMVWAFVRETAQEMANEITKEDIGKMVGEFYDGFVADTDLAKLITRELLVEQVWAFWQKYVKVQSVARAGVMMQVQGRRKVHGSGKARLDGTGMQVR